MAQAITSDSLWDLWIVVKEGAYLMVPDDDDSSKTTWTNDRSKATRYFKGIAELWAWDLDGNIEPANGA